MNRLVTLLEKYLVPFASKIGQQRHLVAVRDAFVVSMPLMILGSLGTLINTLPIPGYQEFMSNLFGEHVWQAYGSAINFGTIGSLSLLVVMALGYKLGQSYKLDGIISATIALSSFIVFGGINGINSRGLFVALFCGIISIEIFKRLSSKQILIIKMPDGVPPAVSKSFESLLPAMITVAIFGIVPILAAIAGIEDVIDYLYTTIQEPLMGLSNNIFAAILIPFLIQILWFFGLHGGNILGPFMETINAPAIDANITALAAGEAAPFLINKPFMTAFVHIGGAGTTVALLIAIFLVARQSKALMTLGKLSAPGIMFNVNEPLVFGIPTVLNPILFIPYIFGPIILSVFSYLVTLAGLVPPATFVVPWNASPIIGGILATQSWQGGVLAAVNICISTLIYIPFVRILAKKEGMNSI